MPNGMTVQEYQDFVSKNHGLIRAFLRKNDLAYTDFYDIAAIGLCKAAQVYDESLGYAFSSLAFRCMKSELGHYFNNEKAQKRSNYTEIPLSNYEDHDEYDNARLLDPSNFADDIESQDLYERYIKLLTPMEIQIFLARLDGYSSYAIAKTLGKTHQRIYQILKRMQEKYMKILEIEQIENERLLIER